MRMYLDSDLSSKTNNKELSDLFSVMAILAVRRISLKSPTKGYLLDSTAISRANSRWSSLQADHRNSPARQRSQTEWYLLFFILGFPLASSPGFSCFRCCCFGELVSRCEHAREAQQLWAGRAAGANGARAAAAAAEARLAARQTST